MSTFTTDQVIDTLTSEGHSSVDILGAIDSLIECGLELPQPDDARAFTHAEVDVLRAELAGDLRVAVVILDAASGVAQRVDVAEEITLSEWAARKGQPLDAEVQGSEVGQPFRVELIRNIPGNEVDVDSYDTTSQ